MGLLLLLLLLLLLFLLLLLPLQSLSLTSWSDLGRLCVLSLRLIFRTHSREPSHAGRVVATATARRDFLRRLIRCTVFANRNSGARPACCAVVLMCANSAVVVVPLCQQCRCRCAVVPTVPLSLLSLCQRPHGTNSAAVVAYQRPCLRSRVKKK